MDVARRTFEVTIMKLPCKAYLLDGKFTAHPNGSVSVLVVVKDADGVQVGDPKSINFGIIPGQEAKIVAQAIKLAQSVVYDAVAEHYGNDIGTMLADVAAQNVPLE